MTSTPLTGSAPSAGAPVPPAREYRPLPQPTFVDGTQPVVDVFVTPVTSRDGLPALPRVSAAAADDIEEYRSVGEPLATLLSKAPLPDDVLATMAAATGVGGFMRASSNSWMGEGLWLAMYDATAGIGRYRLVERRLLSDRMRHHIVHVAKERSPRVIPHIVSELSDDDLTTLASTKLGSASLRAVRDTQEARAAGDTQVRSESGHGGVPLSVHDLEVADFDVAASPVTATPRMLDPGKDGWARAVAEYLLGRLGHRRDRWHLLATLLVEPGSFTWASVSDAVIGISGADQRSGAAAGE